jgi:hypothetical protein
MSTLLIIAALALQPATPSPANPIRVEGPTKICFGQASFEAEAGETVTLDYAGVHWAGIRVRSAEGDYYFRTGDMLVAPKGVISRPIGGTVHQRARRYPTWSGIRDYVLYGQLRSDPGRWRPIVMVRGRTTGERVGGWLLNRINIDESDPGSCNHRLYYGRARGGRG